MHWYAERGSEGKIWLFDSLCRFVFLWKRNRTLLNIIIYWSDVKWITDTEYLNLDSRSTELATPLSWYVINCFTISLTWWRWEDSERSLKFFFPWGIQSLGQFSSFIYHLSNFEKYEIHKDKSKKLYYKIKIYEVVKYDNFRIVCFET